MYHILEFCIWSVFMYRLNNLQNVHPASRSRINLCIIQVYQLAYWGLFHAILAFIKPNYIHFTHAIMDYILGLTVVILQPIQIILWSSHYHMVFYSLLSKPQFFLADRHFLNVSLKQLIWFRNFTTIIVLLQSECSLIILNVLKVSLWNRKLFIFCKQCV